MLKFSAEDIANQTFEKSFRGYDPDQVEEFLRIVAREWEHLRSELERAREEASERSDELEEYREREKSLQDALETAQSAADDIREKAEREAELKIADAEVEADRILSSVEQEVQELQEDIRRLREQRNQYEAELRSLLESHLEMVERMENTEFGAAISRSPSVGRSAGSETGSSEEGAEGEDQGNDEKTGRAPLDSSTADSSTPTR